MKSLIAQLTIQYDKENNFIKTKAQYTLWMLVIISIYATFALLVVIQNDYNVIFSLIVFALYCLVMIFIWLMFRKGHLLLSQYTLFLAGVGFGMLHFGYNIHFHFYIQIVFVLIVSVVVYIKNSELIIMHSIAVCVLLARSVMLFIWQGNHELGTIVFQKNIFLVISILALIGFLHAFNNIILKGIRETGILQEIAEIDILTSLYNRKKFNSDMELHRLMNQSIQLAVVDIDFFKGINDAFGHLSGDVVLQQLSVILKVAALDECYKVYRWGGEEFVIIAEESSSEKFEGLLEEIRHQVEIFLFDVPRRITISIGVSLQSGQSRTEKLFSEADDALYQAKNLGRNRLVKIGDIYE